MTLDVAVLAALPGLAPPSGFAPFGADDAATSMAAHLFSFGISPVEKVIRTVAVYLGIAIIIRLLGKRLMAQMNSLDLVVVLLLSNVVQNAIIGEDNSLAGGLLGALILVLFNAGLDRLGHRVPRVRLLLEGRPSVVVRDGKPDVAALNRLGITRHELHGALRHQGADRIEEVAKATIEPGGTVTVDLRRADQPVSNEDLTAAMQELRDYLDERLAGGPHPR